MLPTLRSLIFSALVLVNLPADLVAQTTVKPMKICVSETKELTARPRCKKGESVLTGSTIEQKLKESVIEATSDPVALIGPEGPVGPKGQVGNLGVQGEKGLIDFSGCRKFSPPSVDNTNGSVEKISIYASCVPGVEFIYADQYDIEIYNNSLGTKAVVISRSVDSNSGDNRDYSVEYTMNRTTSVGLGLYSVDLMIFCCPL